MSTKQKNTLSIQWDDKDPDDIKLIHKIKDLIKNHKEDNDSKINLKASIEFNLQDCDVQKDFERMISSHRVYSVLYRLRNEVFRPARKHGYSDKNINLLIYNSGGHDSLEINKDTKFVSVEEMEDKLDEYYNNGEALIGLLEKKYSEILAEESIDEDLCL